MSSNQCGPILYYDPGQVAIIVLESYKSGGVYGELENPRIEALLSPELKPLPGFPAPMHKLFDKEPGIYVAKFKLPSGASMAGTYLALVKCTDGNSERRAVYTIIIRAPSANMVASISGK